MSCMLYIFYILAGITQVTKQLCPFLHAIRNKTLQPSSVRPKGSAPVSIPSSAIHTAHLQSSLTYPLKYQTDHSTLMMSTYILLTVRGA